MSIYMRIVVCGERPDGKMDCALLKDDNEVQYTGCGVVGGIRCSCRGVSGAC